MNVAQYPHNVYLYRQRESKQDANGYITENGDGEWIYICKGRFEGNGKGQTVTTDTATKEIISGIVYCKPSVFIPSKARILVLTEIPEEITSQLLKHWEFLGKVKVNGINLKTVKDQLNTKLYIN